MRRAFGLAVLLVLLAGCIPEHGGKYSLRGPIEKRSLEFIKVGSTTREEVLLNLGDPDWLSEKCFFGYRYRTQAMTIEFLGDGGIRPVTLGVYALVIWFDDNGVVTHYETNKVDERSRYWELPYLACKEKSEPSVKQSGDNPNH